MLKHHVNIVMHAMPLTNEKEKRPINHGLCEKKKKISLWP
jgi:hypothetical protein